MGAFAEHIRIDDTTHAETAAPVKKWPVIGIHQLKACRLKE
jgi:hypothetical protein